MTPEVKELIRGLLLRAVHNELPLEELYATWPEETQDDPFAEVVYDDIESAVEHFPLDQEHLLELDLLLLDAKGTSADLPRVRRVLLRQKDQPSAAEIRRLLSSSS